MGKRFGLVGILATALLLSSPQMAIAAPTASDVASQTVQKPAVKKVPAKAKQAKAKSFKAKSGKATKVAVQRAPRVRYNAPIYSSIIVDAGTGRVLSEDNADTRAYPASLTKMMTLFMLFEALERGQVTMDTEMPVSAHAAAAAPSKLGLTRKQKITVEQAIGALITKSANDVAIVTAEKLGGTEPSFVDLMTDRARQLGMSNTTFKNASGLPNPQQFSTARDMANLANHLIKDFPQHYASFSRMDYNYKGQTIRTHNRLLEFYEGADGIKTGYTAASGFNLVGSATRNGYRVIGVMFGGATASTRDKRLAGLMDAGFNNLSGLPNTAIASNGNTLPFIDRNDTIGTQIAAIDKPTEQGDSDTPFVSVTDTVGAIETTSLPPIAAPAKPTSINQVRTAALAQPVPNAPSGPTASMNEMGDVGGIQIGVFSSRDRAVTQADAAVRQLKATYSGVTAVVMPVKVKGKMVYRARVMGIAEDELLRACSMVPKALKAGACQAIRPQA